MQFPKTVVGIKCNDCRREIEYWEERIEDRKQDYDICKECAFISGQIDEQTYLYWNGETALNAHAEVEQGKIIIWYGNQRPMIR